MRTTFIETLCQLAAEDERVWLLCGDLGYSVLEVFAARFPGRYVNVGVAEQNMTGLAAGLASCGKVVFTYSIANFPVMRCLEQIRNDVCYHNANVKIVAVGGGLAYGAQGYTHHGVEDLAVTRVLPNMSVFAPGDPVETRWATRAAAQLPGPCYVRLGKAKEPLVHQSIPDFAVGKAVCLREGTDVTLISTGGVLEMAVKAADRLRESGLAARVLSFPTVQPADTEAVLRAARETGGIVTVEEHGLGGLGTIVAEILCGAGIAVPFKPLSLGREPFSQAGSQETLRASRGLSVEGIVAAVASIRRRAKRD